MRKTGNPRKYCGLFVAGVCGLVLLCASQSWAGSGGPGYAQRLGGAQAPAPAAIAHYTYCFGGLAGTGYFSPVITSAPAAYKPEQASSLGIDFGAYLTKTLRVSNSGGQCFTSEAMATTVSAKKQREAELVYRKWKIVETTWTGNR